MVTSNVNGNGVARGNGGSAPSTQEQAMGLHKEISHEKVSEYYGVTLTTTEDLKTTACCDPTALSPKMKKLLAKLPDEVLMKYYGCGSPTPDGIDGLRVLDLGCGSGRDCYLVSALVGEHGQVTGVDMTDQQLEVARRHNDTYCKDTLGYSASNMSFLKGHIEDLASAGIGDASQDLIISNCVINLSPNKPAVLREAFRVLADGGEMYFSDVYCDRRLPIDVRKHEVLVGECLGGAMYIEDFKRLCREVGFMDPRSLTGHVIEVTDPALKDVVGEAKFYSITYRLFKFPQGVIETLCEDYGQVAYYKGTIPGNPNAYQLDDHHRFEKNKPMLVCGNTASMVGESWMAKHFTIVGDRSVHYGLFDCGPGPLGSDAPNSLGGCC
mmetsp:Transcript_12013/g.43864  ORF Transcript_12013/g.43864 Transcript_12013/m.43864 type:complete len:382 (-) Transcript_12013:4227-5372(-)